MSIKEDETMLIEICERPPPRAASRILDAEDPKH